MATTICTQDHEYTWMDLHFTHGMNRQPPFTKIWWAELTWCIWRSHHSVICIFIEMRDLMRLGRAHHDTLSNRENPILVMQLCLHKLLEASRADEINDAWLKSVLIWDLMWAALNFNPPKIISFNKVVSHICYFSKKIGAGFYATFVLELILN